MTIQVIYFIITGLAAIGLGLLIASLWLRNKFTTKITTLENNNNTLERDKSHLLSDLEKLNANLTEAHAKKEELIVSITQKEGLVTQLQDKLTENKNEIEKLQEKFTKEFENLANKILEEKSTKFTEQNKENLKQILSPLNEKIQHFEKKVEETHKESIDYHAALRQQIIGLKELNQQMSKETLNLTKALKGDSKTQGNWGELVLERVLEKSGLEKGREYEIEQSFDVNSESRQRLRPDVIIHLPDGKKMIVDSKVSLTHYEQYINAEDEDEQSLFIKQHIQSLNRHVEQLSAKRYEDIYQIESPDFVLMFIPIEPAFAIALQHDKELYNKAFDKNIVIVTPTTLLATLRTIDTLWKHEKRQQNALEIADAAGKLYDKFVGLVNDLTQIGKRMDDAKKEYSSAMNKLVEGRGNLISRVENLKKLGIKTQKSISESVLKRANNDE
jgi:DNA recombination protein RmuC